MKLIMTQDKNTNGNINENNNENTNDTKREH
jgi:hypothetical protein